MIPSVAQTVQVSGSDVGISLLPGLIGLVIGLAILGLICYLLYTLQQAVPPEHRRIQPGQIWLLLIPLFNLFWIFIVFLRIPESYQSAFAARGMPHLGATEKSIGLAYAICAVCSIIPCLGLFAALASLVLLIIFLVKMFGLKSQLQSGGGGGFPMTPVPPQA